MVLPVLFISAVLNFNDDSYNYKYIQIANNQVAQGPEFVCDGNALTYFRLSSDLNKNDKLNLDVECENFTVNNQKVPDDPNAINYLNFTVFFQRQVIEEGQMPTVANAKSKIKKILSREETIRRRLSIPTGHSSCSPGGSVRCLPGPCRIWEYDYQARNNFNWAETNASSDYNVQRSLYQHYFRLVGQVTCGPLFGVQATRTRDNLQVPTKVDFHTIKMFPSLTLKQEDEPFLNSPEEFRVPVPKNNTLNLNPLIYYRDSNTILHKYGIVDSRNLADNDCHTRKLPPKLKPTMKTRWTTNSSMHVLGNFDSDAAFESFTASAPTNLDDDGVTPTNDVTLRTLATSNASTITLSADNLDYVNFYTTANARKSISPQRRRKRIKP